MVVLAEKSDQWGSSCWSHECLQKKKWSQPCYLTWAHLPDSPVHPLSGAKPVWWWAAESRSHSVFGETSRRLPDRRAFGIPGLWAEIDGCPSHQEVRICSHERLHSLSPLIISLHSAAGCLFTLASLCHCAGTSSTRRRRHLWWSTTSSWRPTWPTESSCSTAFPPGRRQPTRKSQEKHWRWCLSIVSVTMTVSLLSPQSLLAGMNRFLALLGITFRRDPNNFRPRINKLNSIKVHPRFLLKRCHTSF